MRPYIDPDGHVVVDVGSAPANLATVQALARLQLTARRLGRRVRMRGASPELRDLIALCGLSETLKDG